MEYSITQKLKGWLVIRYNGVQEENDRFYAIKEDAEIYVMTKQGYLRYGHFDEI